MVPPRHIKNTEYPEFSPYLIHTSVVAHITFEPTILRLDILARALMLKGCVHFRSRLHARDF